MDFNLKGIYLPKDKKWHKQAILAEIILDVRCLLNRCNIDISIYRISMHMEVNLFTKEHRAYTTVSLQGAKVITRSQNTQKIQLKQ